MILESVSESMPSLGDLPDASNRINVQIYFADLDGTQRVCGKTSADAQSAHVQLPLCNAG